MLPTPRASGQENPESLIKRKGLREAMQHNLTAAVQLMYPTPKARDYRGEEGKRVIKTKTGWSKERKGSKVRYGASLNDVMEYQMMYPTPTKGMHKQDVNDNGEYARRIKSKGNQIMLPAHVKLYPTPRVSDTEGGIVKNVELNNGSFSRKNKEGTRWGVKLKDAVNYLEEKKMYQTPHLGMHKVDTPNIEYHLKRLKKGKQLGLPGQVFLQKMYGTPKEQDSRAALTDRGKKNMGEQVHQENNAKVTGARLSPNFVEFLMGYPPNWTKLEQTD